jgi:hypothetical protein
MTNSALDDGISHGDLVELLTDLLFGSGWRWAP